MVAASSVALQRLIIVILKKGAAMGKNLSDGNISFLSSYRITTTVTEKEVSLNVYLVP